MKKSKQPGDNISLKTKKNEDPAIMQWINSQTNLMDSIRYLIEKEVTHNGVRNLQAFIPAERGFTSEGKNGQAGPSGEVAAVSLRETAAAAQQEEKRQPVKAPDDDIDDEDIESWT
ncbi:hypothetical protein MJA45_27840 [Paenibacillus aurantius]|uniref:Uncharacterized protein n=1 Tax=Paenibacillus aurantius TaxID=2918900 RepID=A0AA96RFE3_9BACL|nr:hypothetical protein [Paenibacillus aurantius]WNQ11366.1 hypothetical protein MJA45_27840 [Paenibacillus aurantius]